MNRQITLSILVVLLTTWSSFSQTAYKTEFYSVAGKKMAYKSFGLKSRKPGQPVIVFESGLGAGGGNFESLFPSLVGIACGIAYDRNGIGQSQADSTVRGDEDVVNRLHFFLKSLNVKPPYILVGHSVGGAFVRLFASIYPNEVVGLVFIDATDFMLTKEEDEQVKTFSRSATGYRELWITMMEKFSKDTSIPVNIRNEMARVRNASTPNYFKEYTSLTPLPKVPVAVLIAYNRPVEPTEAPLYEELKINPGAWWKELNTLRIQHFAQMIENNQNSKLILLPQYSHGIHNQDPELVGAVILDVYRKSIKTKR